MKKISKAQRTINTKKIKFNSCIILIFLLFSISFALADTIEDTKITVKIYNISKVPKNNTVFTSGIQIKVEVINNEYYGNNQNFTFTIFNNTVVNENRNFNLIFIKNESVGMDVVSQYVACLNDKSKCLEEKASYNTAWTACVLDLDEYEGENATTNKEELDSCNLRIQEKDIEIGGKDNTIKDLEDEKKDTENLKWIYAIIAIIIGVVGCLIYCGKIGKGAVKDKSMNEFSKRQSS